MKLELVCDEGDELTISGFALGITDRVAEKSLQRIQIATMPCHLNSMTNRSFNTAGCGLECFRHLGVQYFGDGVSLPDGKQGGFRAQSENAGFHK